MNSGEATNSKLLLLRYPQALITQISHRRMQSTAFGGTATLSLVINDP
jgi:hypothetical protein